MARLLISNGADVNGKDNIGETPLHEGGSIRIEKNNYLSMNILIDLFNL